VRSTEQLFRDWTVHLAGEPFERQRKKLSYEKLRATFDEEVQHVRDVVRRQEALAADSRTVHSRIKEEPRSVQTNNLDDFDCHGLLDDSPSEQQRQERLLEEEANLRSRLAQEREQGIRRIQGQVAEVNHIFRDLASIVSDQGIKFETIEQQASMASSSTREAGEELKKAAARQKSSAEWTCWMFAGAALFLFLLVLPYLPDGFPSFQMFGSGRESALSKADGAPETGVPDGFISELAPGQEGGITVVHRTGRLAR
jgi:hypothetical protein